MQSLKKTITKIIFLLSCIFPRNKKTFVFIGWHKKKNGEVFADNAKYFFLFLSQNHKEVKSIWIAKSRELAQKLTEKGYISYYQKSLLGIMYQLRAGFFVIDAYMQPENYMFSGRSKTIQLLHGKGMKKKGYGDKPDKTQDYIFNTSPFTLKILPDIFKENSKNFITGYSRNDIFYKEIKDSEIDIDEKMITNLKQILGQKKIVMYAPTFRRGQKEFDIEKVLPIEKLKEFAKKENFFFILSFHNKYRTQQSEGNIYEDFGFLEESDVYPLLPFVDVLITDYSSLFADYLLLDKPIIFYPYDLKEYSEKEGLAEDYDKITPGPKAFDYESLLNNIKLSLENDNYKDERKSVRDLYHENQDGYSSERIWDIISKEEKI